MASSGKVLIIEENESPEVMEVILRLLETEYAKEARIIPNVFKLNKPGNGSSESKPNCMASISKNRGN